MNIHPIFVHFPIAFLTIYAVAELIRSKKILSLIWWRYTKMVLLFVGLVGAFISLGTGEFGEKEFAAMRAVIHVHETVAQITTVIFSALVAYYLVFEISTMWGVKITSTAFAGLWNSLVWLFTKVFSSPVIIILAFAGLIAISITGALGGAIVYGPDADLIIRFVYSLFF